MTTRELVAEPECPHCNDTGLCSSWHIYPIVKNFYHCGCENGRKRATTEFETDQSL